MDPPHPTTQEPIQIRPRDCLYGSSKGLDKGHLRVSGLKPWYQNHTHEHILQPKTCPVPVLSCGCGCALQGYHTYITAQAFGLLLPHCSTASVNGIRMLWQCDTALQLQQHTGTTTRVASSMRIAV